MPHVKEKVQGEKVTTTRFCWRKPLEFGPLELLNVFPADRSFHQRRAGQKDHPDYLRRPGRKSWGRSRKDGLRGEKDGPRADAGARRERRAKPSNAEEAGPVPAAEEAVAPEDEAPGKEAVQEPGPQDETSRERRGREAEKEMAEKHDAGKIKLVKDIFGAEIIEEIKLGE